jgi:hypothetical protein
MFESPPLHADARNNALTPILEARATQRLSMSFALPQHLLRAGYTKGRNLSACTSAIRNKKRKVFGIAEKSSAPPVNLRMANVHCL